MSYDKNNIFAKILKGEANAEKVYENEHVLCFKDIFPKAKIHVLIIPKNQYSDIYEFSKNSSSKEKESIFSAFERLINIYKIEKSGCRIITNHGIDGRQEVPHLHFHLLAGQDIGRMTNN
ncbi:MAG: putative HIT-like protein [Alphaproteobacteria bacterium MarineAlpha9_Bin4]|nr:histidine triad nucleotide-binding protein [Pelagibacterales bacterium]PPR25377.1 MAG: putative HIT-like protein [Alphaproteobacteria bacterium MarineAlpha9_Bin4]|tara:strand:+ start:463 stop:822 length:360 start_codon:yes stop_codon:yes gene_type:complete